MSDFAVQKPMRTISLSFGSSSEAVVTRLIDWPNIVFRYSKKPSQNTRFLCKHRAVSLLLRPAIKVCKQFGSTRKIVRRAWSGANMHTKSYNIVRLCVRWSPHAERNISVKYLLSDACHGRIQRGDRGSGPPLKNHKNIGFPSNIDNHKATKPAFNGGPLSTMAFRWWLMVVHF